MSLDLKRSIRTAIQTGLAIALALPAILQAAGFAESFPWVAGAVAFSAGLARVMALPVVQQLLPSWLRTLPEPGSTPEVS